MLYFWKELSNAVLVDQIFPQREEAIQLDGLNGPDKELKREIRKVCLQAEVSRMMKLIINSLYKNKEVSSHMVMMLFCFCMELT